MINMCFIFHTASSVERMGVLIEWALELVRVCVCVCVMEPRDQCSVWSACIWVKWASRGLPELPAQGEARCNRQHLTPLHHQPLKHTHTHTHTHARAHTHTAYSLLHTHTHTHTRRILSHTQRFICSAVSSLPQTHTQTHTHTQLAAVVSRPSCFCRNKDSGLRLKSISFRDSASVKE